VPTLYDVKQKRIVSNESSEIIRMFYYAFDDVVAEEFRGVDLFPQKMRSEIEEMNKWVYDDVNNGVYKSGFATYVAAALRWTKNHANKLITEPKTPTRRA
jgi:putative glutathione S-transferase